MIVVTTPTGQIGRQVLELVLGSHAPVRVIVRDPARLAPGVRDLVEVVQGSHADPDVLARGLRGADCLFWVVPPDVRASSVDDHYNRFTRPACSAIVAQGVPRVVAVSSLGHDHPQKAGLLSGAFAMDALIEATAVHYRALCMPFFMENLLNQAGTIRASGRYTLPNDADRPLATVATRDVARVAAGLLMDPFWTGQDHLAVVGPDRMSPSEMAVVMSAELRRPVHYEHADADRYRAALTGAGMTEAWALGLVETARAQDDGIYDTGLHVAGPGPTDFRRWCKEVLAPVLVADRAHEIEVGFAHLHAVDPVLAALIDLRPDYDADAWRLDLPAMDLFGCLVFQITGQQISLASAGAILGRLTEMFGGRMPGPSELVQLDEQTLRTIGLSWRKARTVLDLAARFADGRLSEERLATLDDDQVLDELTRINGIGPWTVHGALLIALRRADVVPTGDIMLRNTIRTCYELDHLPSEQEVLAIADAWHPYGSLGVSLLFAAAELDAKGPGTVTASREPPHPEANRSNRVTKEKPCPMTDHSRSTSQTDSWSGRNGTTCGRTSVCPTPTRPGSTRS